MSTPAPEPKAIAEATAQAAGERPGPESTAGSSLEPGVTIPTAASNPPRVEADTDRTLDPQTEEADDARFRILRLHDRGGLGEVYVALDRELNREVALKRIRDEHADNTQGQARFVVEAEITGNLEHPGVVPIYSLGRDDSGRPYYAMRFIKGNNLKSAADRFHQADTSPGRDPRERALELRRLLARFLDVCDAIEYAHSRGVLHRDIKPANVMLGRFGETLVVDWGLAKSVGRPDHGGGAADAEGTLAPESSSGLQPTLAGSRLGTPAYMSPEQATGRLDRLGPASDVYSLGATLYYLLVGKAPFEGSDLPEILRRVEAGELVRPRSINPQADPALESICLKAMAADPARRYPSARALAVDIEHWLADEPTSAYREPLLVRLRRWGRRHRTAVTIGAGVLQTTVVVLAVSTWLLSQSRTRIEHQRRAAVEAQRTAEREHQNAAESLKRAEAVNSFLVKDLLEQANPELGGGGGTMPLSEAVARAVVALDAKSGSFQQPEIEAAIRGTIGDAYTVIGDPKVAVQQLRKAKALLTNAAQPDAFQQVWTTNRLANALYFADSYEESLGLYRQAAESAQAILGPLDPESAYAVGGIGNALLALGQVAESIAYTRKAAAILEQTAGPRDRRTQAELNNLMLALAGDNQLDEAEALGRRLLELRVETLPSGHLEIANSRHNLARVLLQKGSYAEALPVQTRAVEEMTRILGPENFRTLYTTNNLGVALEGNGQLDEAEATLRKTLELRRKLLGDHNSNTQRTTAFLARLLVRRNNPEAGKLLRELVRLRRADNKSDPTPDRDLDRIADVLSETADPSVSEPILRELIATLERAFWPGDWFIAHLRSLLGGCLLRQGRTSEASSLLSASLKTMESASITPEPLLERAQARVRSLATPPPFPPLQRGGQGG
jgi:eukaryotic-like serine/threonine-protein kinase